MEGGNRAYFGKQGTAARTVLAVLRDNFEAATSTLYTVVHCGSSGDRGTKFDRAEEGESDGQLTITRDQLVAIGGNTVW